MWHASSVLKETEMYTCKDSNICDTVDITLQLRNFFQMQKLHTGFQHGLSNNWKVAGCNFSIPEKLPTADVWEISHLKLNTAKKITKLEFLLKEIVPMRN